MTQDEDRSHRALCSTLDSILQQQAVSEAYPARDARLAKGEFSFIPFGTERFLTSLAVARLAFAAQYGRPAES